MPNQHDVTDLGGTLRLGSYPCVLSKDSKSYELYGTEYIHERHRHRYEVNNDYRKALTDNGMELVGLSPDGHIVEMIEIPDHPWFIGTQAHPEFKSRPNKAHPLFKGFVAAALAHEEQLAIQIDMLRKRRSHYLLFRKSFSLYPHVAVHKVAKYAT